jgi:hypothetical protein
MLCPNSERIRLDLCQRRTARDSGSVQFATPSSISVK